MPVTRRQAELIAELAAACRPHGARQWDQPGIVHAISKVTHLALADVAAAALRGASDRTLETPAAIGNPASSCWRERLAEATHTRPTICRTHGTQHHGICPSCRAEAIAADGEPPLQRGQRLRPDEIAAAVAWLKHEARPDTTTEPTHEVGSRVSGGTA